MEAAEKELEREKKRTDPLRERLKAWLKERSTVENRIKSSIEAARKCVGDAQTHSVRIEKLEDDLAGLDVARRHQAPPALVRPRVHAVRRRLRRRLRHLPI